MNERYFQQCCKIGKKQKKKNHEEIAQVVSVIGKKTN
jgi:hypothetical protein